MAAGLGPRRKRAKKVLYQAGRRGGVMTARAWCGGAGGGRPPPTRALRYGSAKHYANSGMRLPDRRSHRPQNGNPSQSLSVGRKYVLEYCLFAQCLRHARTRPPPPSLKPTDTQPRPAQGVGASNCGRLDSSPARGFARLQRRYGSDSSRVANRNRWAFSLYRIVALLPFRRAARGRGCTFQSKRTHGVSGPPADTIRHPAGNRSSRYAPKPNHRSTNAH